MKYATVSMISVLVGFLLGSLYNTHTDVENPVITEIKTDTITKNVYIKVPEIQHDIVYINHTDTLLKLIPDSILVTLTDTVPIQTYNGYYSDSLLNMKYNIKTYGYLLDFKPTFEIYQRRPYCPKYNWSIIGSISNRGHMKFGLGYKHFITEIEVSNKFEQIYFGTHYKL